MAREPRGCTFTVTCSDDAWRTAKWGVRWNKYEEGRTGRPKQRSEWFATQAEAEEFAAGMRAAAIGALRPTTAPTPIYRAKDSLAYFAEQVFLPFAEDNTEAATHKGYKDSFKNWLAPAPGHKRYPGLGTVVLNDTFMTKRVVKEYLERLYKAKVSLAMRRRLHRALSACLKHAGTEERLTTNPCSKLGEVIAHKGERDADPTPNPFAPEEITRIFDQLYATEDLCWQVYYLWQYHVGTRPGEAGALKWAKLDLDRKRGRIEWAYCPISKKDKAPKTYECRDVDLTSELVTLLLKWRAVQREEAFRRGYPAPEYVFTTRLPARTVRNVRQLTRITQYKGRAVFARTMQTCKITDHTPYDFRDSFATSHLALGWDRKLAWVSKQLGHKHPTTTQKFYYAYRDTVASRTFADEIGGFK